MDPNLYIDPCKPDYSLIWTTRSSVYKSDKGANDAACPPEGGPAEAGSLLNSSLPVIIDCLASMPDSQLKSLYVKQWLVMRYLTRRKSVAQGLF